MRRVDYHATHMVKAVKGLELHPNAWTQVTINGAGVKIRERNKDEAIKWFGEWAAPLIDGLGPRRKVLIPIPSSSTVRNSEPNYRTKILCDAIGARMQRPASVAPILRWRRPMIPSRQGGPRDPHALYPELILIGPITAGDCILVDDVETTGGHFIAAAWALMDLERTPSLAVTCGRTLHRQLDDPFIVADEELDISR